MLTKIIAFFKLKNCFDFETLLEENYGNTGYHTALTFLLWVCVCLTKAGWRREIIKNLDFTISLNSLVHNTTISQHRTSKKKMKVKFVTWERVPIHTYIHLKSLTQGNEVTISRSNVSFFKKMSTFSPAEAYPQALRSITTKRTVNVNILIFWHLEDGGCHPEMVEFGQNLKNSSVYMCHFTWTTSCTA